VGWCSLSTVMSRHGMSLYAGAAQEGCIYLYHCPSVH
jgi:hypothetical protein